MREGILFSKLKESYFKQMVQAKYSNPFRVLHLHPFVGVRVGKTATFMGQSVSLPLHSQAQRLFIKPKGRHTEMHSRFEQGVL